MTNSYSNLDINQDASQTGLNDLCVANAIEAISSSDLLGNIIFWIKDEQNQFLYVNKAFLNHLNISHFDEIKNKTDHDIYPDELAKHYCNDDNQVLTGRSISQRMELNFSPSGKLGWYLTSKKPVFDKQGKIRGTTGTTRFLEEKDNTPKQSDVFQKAVNFINDNYKSEIKIADLAQMYHLSTSTLERRFKRKFNKTPSQYIVQLRLNHARRMLIDSHLSVSAIACETGFSDHSYFSKIYKNFFDESPSKTRRLHID